MGVSDLYFSWSSDFFFISLKLFDGGMPYLCHRGGKSTWPDWDLNPGPLAYEIASTLTTELLSHMVDL